MTDHPDHETIPIAEFDRLAKAKQFAVGPFIDTFGDAWHDPYNPIREVWGELVDGRKVKSTKHYGA